MLCEMRNNVPKVTQDGSDVANFEYNLQNSTIKVKLMDM